MCVAPHRTIVLEISLTHAFANVLGIEYGRLLMTEMVKFVLFITFSDCKQYVHSCNFSRRHVFFFKDILTKFDISGVVW